MKLGIMQPYWFPYVGYWQLIKAVDIFVVYDTIQYTKKGWVSRNRFLLNGRDEVFSISLAADGSELDIRDREVAPSFDPGKLLRRLEGAYRKAPCFTEVFRLVQSLIEHPDRNLFGYINHSISGVCDYLGVSTPRLVASTVEHGERLQGKDRVLSLCRTLGANEYLNPIGGLDLYDRREFDRQGVRLQFLRARSVEYPQFGHPFVPWLSIVDVLMFNPRDRVQDMLDQFDIE